MFYGCFFSFRNDVGEMKLKLADTFLKLGEIGMETGTALCVCVAVELLD